METKLIVAMPFSRLHNLELLVEAMANVPEMMLTLIVQRKQRKQGGLDLASIETPTSHVSVRSVDDLEEGSRRNPCFYKINKLMDLLFKDHLDGLRKKYIYLTTDDNGYSADFFPRLMSIVEEELKKEKPADILMLPERRPGAVIQARIESMQAFCCDFSQFVVRADFLYANPLNEHLWYEDSLWPERMRVRKATIRYLGDPVVLYNALRSGQWSYPGVWDDPPPAGNSK